MKTFIAALIIAVFLQTSFVPINLVLLFLISRSLIFPQQSNLYLAFIFGIVLGILSGINIGFYAGVFLLATQLSFLVKKTSFTANPLTVIPVSFLLLLMTAYFEQLFLNQAINFKIIFIESALSVVIYLMVKFWEERFTVAPQVKLKL